MSVPTANGPAAIEDVEATGGMKAVVAIGLAVVGGSVDAIGLAEAGRFSSHMTGTTTHTMTRLVEGQMLLVALGFLAILAFLCGAAATGYTLTTPRAIGRTRTVAQLVTIETVFIALAGVAMLSLARGTWTGMAIIALLAFAMGLQNATSTYLLKPYERTTHVTSNMTDLGSEIGLRIRRTLHRPSGELLASPDGGTLSSAFLAIVGFAAGGLGGAALALFLGPCSGLCAAILPAVLSAISTFGGRRLD